MTVNGASVRALLEQARARLAPSPTERLEAEVLLAHVLGVSRSWVLAHPERVVPADEREACHRLVKRRAHGEPLAYLTGSREFWSLPFQVTPKVLIPRPETELLVETALDFIPEDAAWRIADLGTGCGAVAVAIASERPHCEIHATERSAEALRIARTNAETLAPGRVHLHLGSWLEPLKGRFAVIVSNPPYVPEDDPHLRQGDCRYEPREALTPGEDGMAAIGLIARNAMPRLEAGGLLAFEHGFDQGDASRALLRELGYAGVGTLRDLEGRERVSRGIAP